MKRILIVSEFGQADQNSTGHLISLLPAILEGAEVRILDIRSIPGPFARLHSWVRRNRYLYVLSRLVALFGLIAGAVSGRKGCDAILVGSNPFLSLLVPAGIWRGRNRQLFYLTFDLFPETTVAAGIALPSFIMRFLLWLRNRNLRRADGVLAIGRDMTEHLAKACGVRRAHYLPIWLGEEERGEAQAPWPDSAPILHFFGNMGRVQDFSPLFRLLEENPHLRLEAYGSGPSASSISSRITDRLSFHGGVPFPERARAYTGDIIGVVLQKEELVGLAVPSKSYYYWARGLPILFVGSPLSEIGRAVHENPVLGMVLTPGVSHVGIEDKMRQLTSAGHQKAIRMAQLAHRDHAGLVLRHALGLAA